MRWVGSLNRQAFPFSKTLPVIGFSLAQGNELELVNVDMQNCFVADSPISAPAGLVVLDRINRLASACRQAGILVILEKPRFGAFHGTDLERLRFLARWRHRAATPDSRVVLSGCLNDKRDKHLAFLHIIAVSWAKETDVLGLFGAGGGEQESGGKQRQQRPQPAGEFEENPPG